MVPNLGACWILSRMRVRIAEDERVVFNIKGNTYRLVVAVTYGAHLVVIKFFGARAEHEGLDAGTADP